MIILTGGAGFIGSVLLWKLNSEGIDDIVIVDELGTDYKWKNLTGKKFKDYVHKDKFINNLSQFNDASAVIHLGAISSTAETDADLLMSNNFNYSKELAGFALSRNIRFIYASSAATYGDGSAGFSDESEIFGLRPLNIYGLSKHVFDLWAYKNKALDRIAGIKFFNVFGPNEYHKEDMLSVAYKAFTQIMNSGKVKLYKSYRTEYGHGEQKRDFIYVKDCAEVIWWFLQNKGINGIYNLGTGKNRTWNDLVKAVFSAMGIDPVIEYVDMPASMKEQYQYFTEAKMDKIKKAGYSFEFTKLEEAVRDYVLGFLLKKNYL